MNAQYSFWHSAGGFLRCLSAQVRMFLGRITITVDYPLPALLNERPCSCVGWGSEYARVIAFYPLASESLDSAKLATSAMRFCPTNTSKKF